MLLILSEKMKDNRNLLSINEINCRNIQKGIYKNQGENFSLHELLCFQIYNPNLKLKLYK